MSTELATVTEVQGPRVVVETRRESSCSVCAARAGCGTAVIGKALGRRRSRMRALSTLRLSPGDEVEISLDQGRLFQASLLMYGVPLTGLFAGAGLAEMLHAPEWVTVLAAGCGLLLGLVLVRRGTARLGRDPRFQPQVTRLRRRGTVGPGCATGERPG